MTMSRAVNWRVLHKEIIALARKRAKHERALCRALLYAKRARIWKRFGMRSLNDYALRFLGLSLRQTQERLRVGACLEQLPRLDRALSAGRVVFTAVRELTRVATPETEEAWIASVKDRTVGEIEALVSGHLPGDRPEDEKTPVPRKHRIVLDLSPEEYAAYHAAQEKLRQEHGAGFTEAKGLELMALQLLGKAREGRSARGDQVTNEAADATSREQAVVFGPADVQMIENDVHLQGGTESAVRADVADSEAQPSARSVGQCGVPGCRRVTFSELFSIRRGAQGGDREPDVLMFLCPAHQAALHHGTLQIAGAPSAGSFFVCDDRRPETTGPRIGGRAGARHASADGRGTRREPLPKAARGPHMGADNSSARDLQLALPKSRSRTRRKVSVDAA